MVRGTVDTVTAASLWLGDFDDGDLTDVACSNCL
jgi:hypothetical protein